MIRLPVNALEPGMVLAAPIPHPAAPDRILLNTDFTFDDQMIRQLTRFPVYTVWIRHPGFDFLDERMSSAIPRSRVVLYESVKNTFTSVANRTTGAFNLLEYRTVVGNMIFSMIANRDHAVWAERILQGEHELFGHCSNVAYLSLLIGMRLRHYLAAERRYVVGAGAEDLTNLGIGAMFHDFGKIFFGPELQRRHLHEDDPDTAEEYQSHALRGYQALQGRMEATATTVVLHHHQRFDGNGFPKPRTMHRERERVRLQGRRIHVFARVVAVANSIESLINHALQQNRPIVAALAQVCSDDYRPMFDPVILDAALRCIPPFSLSSCVTLSDGREAVVTDLNPSQPSRPVVRLFPRPDAPAGEAGEEIDLSAEGAPSIAQEGGRDVTSHVQSLEAGLAALDPRSAAEALPNTPAGRC